MFERFINYFFSKKNKKQSGEFITLIKENREFNGQVYISNEQLNIRRELLLRQLKNEQMDEKLMFDSDNNTHSDKQFN